MSKLINLSFILADIQDGIATDLESELRKADPTLSLPLKRSIDRIKAHASSMVDFVDKETGSEFSEGFGEFSDKIKEGLFKAFGL